MAAPEDVAIWLEFAAARTLEIRERDFFIKDVPMGPAKLSASPVVQLRKTGGTTGHREQGKNYIHYELEIDALKILYSIYIMPATDDPAINQKALARAIRWFIPNYNGGSVFSREEPAA